MKNFKFTSKFLLAGLAAAASYDAQAGSIGTVLAQMANESGQLNVQGNYTFNINNVDTSVSVANGVGGDPFVIDAGDIITTNFVISSISTAGGTGSTATLDSSIDISLGGGNFATTVGAFGTSSFLVTGVSSAAITVVANPISAPLFTVYQDDDPLLTLVPTTLTLPGSDLFGTVGNPPNNSIILTVDSASQSSADLDGLDFLIALGAVTPNVALNNTLIQPSDVTITAENTGTSASAAITLTATVIPSPSAAIAGLVGIGGLTMRRRRAAK